MHDQYHLRLSLLGLVLGVNLNLQAQNEPKYLPCGSPIDGVSDNPRSEITIIVQNDQIQDVVASHPDPPNRAELIDLKDRTVLRGRMDMHVYIEAQQNPRATMESAQLLRIKDRLGSIEKGKLADIIALDDNPLEHIRTLEQIRFVMKDGVVYKMANP